MTRISKISSVFNKTVQGHFSCVVDICILTVVKCHHNYLQIGSHWVTLMKWGTVCILALQSGLDSVGLFLQ